MRRLLRRWCCAEQIPDECELRLDGQEDRAEMACKTGPIGGEG